MATIAAKSGYSSHMEYSPSPARSLQGRGAGRLLALAAAALLGLLLSGSLALAVSAAPAAVPPTFVVNSVSDAPAAGSLTDDICDTVFPYGSVHTCTLRAAIMKANHSPEGGATITFDPSTTNGHAIILTIAAQSPDDETTGDLNISHTTRLVGNGAGLTIIDGQGIQDRVFWLETGALVSMSGLTVQHGWAGQYGGGGLYVNSGAALTLDQVAVISNTDNSGLGGGGLLSGGALTVTHSLLGYNKALESGGGLANNGGRVAIGASPIISNETLAGVGGGLVSYSGQGLSLAQSTVSSNTAAFYGGGLAAEGGYVTVTQSTLSSNLANLDGGGLEALLGAHVSLVNSTLSQNSAVGYGGGLEANQNGSVWLYNVNVADNRADINLTGSGKGGGLSIGSGAIHLQNSLIADNLASAQITGGSIIQWPDDCFAAPVSAGYNLLTHKPDTCSMALITGDLLNPAAHLGPLQANGGPTFTQALLPGSPAIDAANPGGCNDPFGAPLPTDQRGDRRVANGAGATHCDIGAFELQRTINLPLAVR